MYEYDYECLEENKTDTLCCKLYSRGANSDSSIFFYKLRRRDNYSLGNTESEAEFFGLTDADALHEAKKEGRIYDPEGKHTWQTNLSWVLGAVHKNRDIALNSKLDEKNIWRKDYVPKDEDELESSPFSAFAREIAAARKAGYNIHLTDTGTIYLSLKDSLSQDHAFIDKSDLKLSDIDPTQEEVMQAMKDIHLFIISKIEETFSQGSSNALGDYLDYCTLSNKDAFRGDEDYDSDKLDYDALYCDFVEAHECEILKLTNMLSQLTDNGFIYQEGENGLLEDFKQSKLQFEAGKSLSNASSKEEEISASQIIDKGQELINSGEAAESAMAHKPTSSHPKWARIAAQSVIETQKHATNTITDTKIINAHTEIQVSTRPKDKSTIETIPASTSPRLGGH